IKVNFTMLLAGPVDLTKVSLTPVRKLFQVAPALRYTGGVKQFGHRAGRGGDAPPARQDRQSKGGCSQHPPFFVPILRLPTRCSAKPALVHLHNPAKAAYLIG